MSARHPQPTGRRRGRANLAQMRRPPTHPGEVFEEEFRKPSRLSRAEAARRMGMSTLRLRQIVAGGRAITPDTAVVFGKFTDTDSRLWLHMQAEYDVWYAMREWPAKQRRRAP